MFLLVTGTHSGKKLREKLQCSPYNMSNGDGFVLEKEDNWTDYKTLPQKAQGNYSISCDPVHKTFA